MGIIFQRSTPRSQNYDIVQKHKQKQVSKHTNKKFQDKKKLHKKHAAQKTDSFKTLIKKINKISHRNYFNKLAMNYNIRIIIFIKFI